MASPRTDRTGTPRRIVFASSMCMLDQVSGAAQSVRAILETLAAAGHEVQTFTASCFDANTEVHYGPHLGQTAADDRARGKIIQQDLNGVTHNVFITASSRFKNFTEAEAHKMLSTWKKYLDFFKPEVVMSFGTSDLVQSMHTASREIGAHHVLYFGNAEINGRLIAKPGDSIVCVSGYLAKHYEKQLGMTAQVIYPFIAPERYVETDGAAIAKRPDERKLGFITFINPLPHKGLTLFARLATRARRERPDMMFAVLEGRMTRDIVRSFNLDLPSFPNIWWLPPQENMRAVYARTSILMIPSFWREGFGRSVVEAQLSGIPVMASTRGGLVEALGGGGFALDIPEDCAEDHYKYPDDATVDRWWQTLVTLWDDETAYVQATERALEAAAPFAPEHTRAVILSYFEKIFASLGGPQPNAPGAGF